MVGQVLKAGKAHLLVFFHDAIGLAVQGVNALVQFGNGRLSFRGHLLILKRI
jgi:hypothetical protein